MDQSDIVIGRTNEFNEVEFTVNIYLPTIEKKYRIYSRNSVEMKGKKMKS